jgi:hypothetical protein
VCSSCVRCVGMAGKAMNRDWLAPVAVFFLVAIMMSWVWLISEGRP